MLKVAKVKESDKEQVMELSKGIWGGHDYLPHVFDEWVKEGGFYCLKDGEGRILALDKYTWHENGILWLEGYRVHPEHQGKGYGWKMAQGMSQIIDRLDWKAVRFMTAEANDVSIHIGRKMSFRLFASYTYLYLENPEKEDVNGVSMLSDPEKALEMIKGTAEYGINRRQYLAMWTAYDITENLIKNEVEMGHGYALGDAIAFFYPYEPSKTLSIAFIGGNEKDMEGLVRFGKGLAAEKGYSRFTVKSASENVVRAAKNAGMQQSEIGMAMVWEKKR